MNHKIKYIGIDFGSSKTEIAGVDEQGEVFIIPYNDVEESFPTVLAESINGKAEDLFFYDARIKAGDEYKCYDELKEDILNRCERSSLKRVERFFARLYDTIMANASGAAKNSGKSISKYGSDTFDFSGIEKVCFGHPAYYKSQESYCDRIKNIISNTFKIKKENIHECPEPVLAGNAYYHVVKPDMIKKGDFIFILDFGGHTMDLVLLKVDTVENQKGEKVNGLVQVTVPESFHQGIPMGKDITIQLCKRIYDANHPVFDYNVELKKCEFFSGYDGNNYSKYAEGAIMYPDKMRGWSNPSETPKYFRIESNNTGPVSNNSKGKVKHVGIFDQIEFDSIIMRIVEFASEYLDDAGFKEHHQINYILFSGGMSKISYLRQKLDRDLGDYIMSGNICTSMSMDDERKDSGLIKTAFYNESVKLSSSNAVAIGAALEAAGLITCGHTKIRDKKLDNEKIQKLQDKVAYLESKIKTMENGYFTATRAVRREKQEYASLRTLIETKYPKIAAELFRENGAGNGSFNKK